MFGTIKTKAVVMLSPLAFCLGGSVETINTLTAPSNVVLPSFTSSSEDLNMGAMLAANVGSWKGSSLVYSCTWYVNDKIEKAAEPCDNSSKRSKFYLENYYFGQVPTVVVTAANDAGAASASSPPTSTYIARSDNQSVRAGDFNDSIGAAVHMNETGSEYWAPLGYSYSVENISKALIYLPHLNHLRGGWGYKNNAGLVHGDFPNVRFAVGVSCCQYYDGAAEIPDSNGFTSKAWLLANLDVLDAIEAANEIDAQPYYSCPLGYPAVYPTSCPKKDALPWIDQKEAAYTNARMNQQKLWEDFAAFLPVLSPTTQIPINARKLYGEGQVGVNPSNISFVNEHHYTQFQAGQAMQWSYLYARDFQKASAEGVAPIRGRPHREIIERATIITETGWMNCPPERVSGSCKINTPESTIAELLPSMLLDAHNMGVYRTYLYELLDQLPDPGKGLGSEDYHHGLFSLDPVAPGSAIFPKAQTTSLKNLMSFMHDDHPKAKSFAPQQWHYTLVGLPDSGSEPPYHKGQRLLFQRGDGKFILAIWDDVVLWNFSKGEPMPGVPKITQLILTPSLVPSSVSVYDPVADTTKVLKPSASMPLELPNHPILVLITP